MVRGIEDNYQKDWHASYGWKMSRGEKRERKEKINNHRARSNLVLLYRVSHGVFTLLWNFVCTAYLKPHCCYIALNWYQSYLKIVQSINYRLSNTGRLILHRIWGINETSWNKPKSELHLQGDPNQNLLLQMAIAQKLDYSDPML